MERTPARPGNFRRLVVRRERKIEIDSASFYLACILIALRRF